MQRHAKERGAALILLLGITATLVILAATLVMVIINQQSATAGERDRKTSVTYAEGSLDSLVQYVKPLPWPSASQAPVGGRCPRASSTL